jgi:exodeoxyribonuclease VII large subunit
MGELFTNEPPPPNLAELSVSQLAGAIRVTLERSFDRVRVRGELGRVTHQGNGHIYLDLKDDKATINAVVWRTQAARLKIKPEEGLEVIATGRITTFAPRSTYQLVIEELELAGAGALMVLLEKRRKQLAAEGLFDDARKKKLPFLPAVIGVITSPTGAVIRDIMHRLRDRCPAHVILWPVVVQGERAAGEVAAAIAGFNRLTSEGAIPRPDLLIVARGGGSIEDLWAFNEEIVVRAAAASKIPLISAVGHETDTTLIDFAADRRAPTPTAAAEIAVPVRAELIGTTLNLERRLLLAMRRLIGERRQRIEGLARGLPRAEDLVGGARQRFDAVARRLPNALRTRAAISQARFNRVAGRLQVGLLSNVLRAHQRSLAREIERLTRGFARHIRDERAALGRHRMRLDTAAVRLLAGAEARIVRSRGRLDAAVRLLEGLSFERTLERGYTVVSDARGQLMRDGIEALKAGEVEIRFRGDDRVAARVTAPKPKKPAPQGPTRQGKLL